MEKVFTTSYSANPALFAMEDLFLLSLTVVEGTYLAEINGEVLLAGGACFAFRLLGLAAEALDVGHFVPIELMVLFGVKLSLVMDLIVTETARVKGSRADRIRALELARS